MSTFKETVRSYLLECSCLYWQCWQSWRQWFQPVVFSTYLLILLVALPLLIWDLYREQAAAQFKAWFVAGLFVLLTIPIFLMGMAQHLLNYTQPHLQKHIIRILWIVPIYTLNCWFGLKFPSTAIYWNTVRECYEAYVLYNFLCYLLNFLTFEYNLEGELNCRPPVKQPIPWCCCPPWPKGMTYIRRCKFGVLQYTIVRVLVTVVALVTQLAGVYGAGHLNVKNAYLYTALINGVSQIFAIHSLIYFYRGTRDLLKPIHPLWKFLCIKAIVFFAFWQSVAIVILVKTGVVSESSWKNYDVVDVTLGLQNFLICIEMFFFAIAHYFVFSHKPFVDPAAAQVPCVASCIRMLDLRDVYGDVKEHFVDPIPRPRLPKLRSTGETTAHPDTQPDAEMLPLLNIGSSHRNSVSSQSAHGDDEGKEVSFSILTVRVGESGESVIRSRSPVSVDGGGGSGEQSSVEGRDTASAEETGV